MERTWWEIWWVVRVFWASNKTDRGNSLRLPLRNCGHLEFLVLRMSNSTRISYYDPNDILHALGTPKTFKRIKQHLPIFFVGFRWPSSPSLDRKRYDVKVLKVLEAFWAAQITDIFQACSFLWFVRGSWRTSVTIIYYFLVRVCPISRMLGFEACGDGEATL